MRTTPLAVWAQNFTDEEIAQAVKEDVSMTHSNPDAFDIETAYCIAIKNLI